MSFEKPPISDNSGIENGEGKEPAELQSDASPNELMERYLAESALLVGHRPEQTPDQALTQPKKGISRRDISRRDFLQIMGLGILGAQAAAAGAAAHHLYLRSKGELVRRGEKIVADEVYWHDKYTDLIKGEEKISSTQEQEIRQRLSFVTEQFSPQIINRLIAGHEKAKKSRENQAQEVKIDGFEKNGYIKDAVLAEIWRDEQSYPQSYIQGQVQSIKCRVREEGRDDVSHYGLSDKSLAYADKTNDEVVFTLEPQDPFGHSDIELQRPLDLAKVKAWDRTFQHELGHMNDWTGSNDLKAQERLDLLYKVSQAYLGRYHKEGEWKWDYPDQITKEDVYATRLAQVTEWWACLHEDYFQTPGTLQTQRPELYNLVNEHVNRKEHFDPVAALDHHYSAYSTALNKHQYKKSSF